MTTTLRPALRGLACAIALCLGAAHAADAPVTDVLTLGQSFELALAHDADYQAAREQRNLRYEQKDQNLALLLPTIDATASYQQYQFERPAAGQQREFRPNDRVGINLSQPLYNRGNWYRYQQTDNQLRVADLELRQSEQDLALEVAEAYFNILLAQRTLELSRAESEAYEQQWEKTKGALKRGFSTRTDLLDAKARYDEAQSRVLGAENQVLSTRLRLRRRIGEAARRVSLSALRLDDYQPKALDAEEWQVRVEQGNLPILKALAEAELAGKEVQVQQSGHYPQLSLQAGLSDTYNEDRTQIQGFEQRYTLQLTVPLYAGGGVSSRVRESAYRQNAIKAQLRSAREQARQERDTLLATLATNAANIHAYRATVASWDLFVESAEKSHRLGLKDLFTVLDARARRFAAQRELAATVHDELLNRLRLVALAGQLNQDWFEKMDQTLFGPNTNP